MRTFAIMALSALAACAPVPQAAAPVETPSRAMGISQSLPPMRSFAANAAPAPTRSNVDMAADFLDLAFRMESGRTVPTMTRFVEPISVRVTGSAPASLTPDLRALLARLRSEAGIDIFVTGAGEASITIEAVPREALQRAVPRAACFVVPRVSSWGEFLGARRSPQVDWTTLTRRDKAAIFVPSDVSPQEIRDCLHEELAQALGPLNDLYRLPDSVFNDDNIHAVLTGFDMLMLRTYYAPELANGMTRGEVAARLPQILARLNPAGQTGQSELVNDTSRDWIDAMEKALSPGGSAVQRRRAAEEAINLARAFNWTGARPGFAFYAYGRLQIGNDPEIALQSFRQAAQSFRSAPETRLHEAHVAVQLAAFSLTSGDAASTIELTDWAIPVAAQYQNAALLSTLMMFKAEALDLSGRREEAEALRLDSLGWARYGFGSDRNVRARAAEVAALNPGAPS